MTRRFSLRRTGAMLLAGALLFVLAGDRAVTAVALGIDPLEVLDLQVKPNVVVMLDSSGSMEDLTNNNASPYGGDHQRSKMYQAKQVLKAVFQANETKASFLFGVYKFSSPSDPAGNMLPYSTGTATVNSGSTTVNFGGAANIPGDVGNGDVLVFPGAPTEVFTITTRNSSTRVTTSTAASVTHTNQAYRIVHTGSPNRFVYSTQSWAAVTNVPNPACTVDPSSCPVPNANTVTLPVQGPSPSMATGTNLFLNGFYAFQRIQASGSVFNNRLVFNETAGPTCTVDVAPGFYLTGATAATAIQTAMNGCPGKLNTYAVSYGNRVVSVLTLTRAGTVATATTTAGHGFATGDTVTIAGASVAGYNGAKVITGTTLTTFTYTVVNTLGVTAGPITATLPLTANRFTFRGTGTNFTLQWTDAATTLDGVLNAFVNQAVTGTALSTLPIAPPVLLARTAGNTFSETYDPDGLSTTLTPTLDKPSPSRPTTTYNLDAQTFFNGETVYVDSTGNACGIASGAATAMPSVTLQLTTNCASGAAAADPANRVTFTWGGARVGVGAGTCQGFDSKVPLIPCNQTSPLQFVGLGPLLDNQIPVNAAGSIVGYAETNDGSGTVATGPGPGGVIASSNTPLAQTANDVALLFGGDGTTTGLWHGGQAAPALTPIKGHLDPKEKTIYIMVTDGDQNCTPFTLSGQQVKCIGNNNPTGQGCTANAGYSGGAPYSPTTMIGDDAAALGAAAATQKLYNPDSIANKGNGANAGTVNADGTINGDAAASVTTYVVAYGTGASKARSDWIAWGGSGMKRTLATYSGQDTWSTIPTQAERDACTTCIDSFLAPDSDTLKAVLDKVINQGASTGEFSAQQSLTDSIYELSGDVPQGGGQPTPWSPFNPRNRYDPLVPHRFVSTFALPLFTGQIRAYTQDGPDSLTTATATCLAGTACRRWSANDKLVNRVTSGLAATCTTTNGTAGILPSQCVFPDLSKGATTATNFTGGNYGIERRIFTTSRNGVFGPTVDDLIAGQNPAGTRVALWPPAAVAPASDTTQGLFDVELGLPADTAPIDAAFLDLRTNFKACMGTNLPGTCPSMATTSGFTIAQMKRARREAREILLAFLAGAKFLADPVTGNPKRVLANSAPYVAGDIIFVARTEILAESTLATPAVVSPPQEELPEGTSWKPEYELYRDGPRDHSNLLLEPDGEATFAGPLIRSGFGLRNPDRDGNNTSIGTVQGRTYYQDDARAMKPVMTVLYAGSNLALHAFRAGTSVATSITTACEVPPAYANESLKNCGGEELWAYLPYDQLGKLRNRYVNNPQKRDPHDYVIARAIRFSDVFVPTPGTAVDPDDTPVSKTVAGTSLGQIKGVWRKVLFVGRGKGGKYLTAIDVTSPGMFTDLALSDKIVPPVFLWSRGNPDTTDGKPTPATKAHDQADYDAYLTMGETWSVPALAYVGRSMMRADNAAIKATASVRKPKGNDFVLYVGSGYGLTGEGTSFYSMDPLTGDVITRVNVDTVASASYAALVRAGMPYANAIVANPVVFNASRFLYAAGGVKSPNVAAAPARRVYVADLHGRLWKFLTAAPDKPLPVADLGANQPVATAASLLGLPANDPNAKAYVYVTSGNEKRATQNPRFANFGFLDNGSDTSLTVLAPVAQNGIQVYPPMESRFVIPFEDLFRGTVQPATAFSETDPGKGRVFFGGTRFNPPNGAYAPPVPPFPCRSSFDSILYALGASSGLPAYNLAFGNSYQIFQDSRIVALSTQAAPGASRLAKDEGLAKTGQPIEPPPPMGLSPTTQATQNVIPVSGPGLPQPSVRFGSTVCQ